MSKLVAFAAIQGAYNIVSKAEGKYKQALETYGGSQKLEFPNTAYFLAHHLFPDRNEGDGSGFGQETAGVCAQAPAPSREERTATFPTSDPSWTRVWRRSLQRKSLKPSVTWKTPDFYQPEVEDPDIDNGKLWLGAADDKIMRKRGVEFVDGTAPGFAAIVGSAPDSATAKKIAEEYQLKTIYVFMAANQNGTTFAEQLVKEKVQIGWNTRLVPFGPDISAAVFALGFANRAGMAFGGIQPGDYKKQLKYQKDRVFAFVNALGDVNAEWAANAAGCINWGFPTIADTDIPEVCPPVFAPMSTWWPMWITTRSSPNPSRFAASR
jgi:acetyl-CoA synthase